MSIYHLDVRLHGRSTGKRHGESVSVVARAAYRAGEVLTDHRIGKRFDFSKKAVRESFILAPDGSPNWALNRANLWNMVEASESRKDSQLAREIEVSLPRELSHAQQKKLLIEFLQPLVSDGMVIDVGVHEPDDVGGNPQPHAHCLLTMRKLLPDGSGFGGKERGWNPDFAGRGRVKDKNPLMEIRETWATLCNRFLADAGIAERISSKTKIVQIVDALSAENYTLALKLSEAPPLSKKYRSPTRAQQDRAASDIENWRVLHESIAELQKLAELDRADAAARSKVGLISFAKSLDRRHQKVTAKPTPAAQPPALQPEHTMPTKTTQPARTAARPLAARGIQFHSLSPRAKNSAAEKIQQKRREAQEADEAENMNEKQKFKLGLLRKLYGDEQAKLLAARALFVNLKDPDSVSIKLIGGGEVFDCGDQILCGGENQKSEIEAMVQIAKSKRDEAGIDTPGAASWSRVQIHGNDDFVREAAAALAAAGFEVSARDERQDKLVRDAIADALPAGVSVAKPVPARVARAEGEAAAAALLRARDRMLRDPYFCRAVLVRLGDEDDSKVLARLTARVRDQLKSNSDLKLQEPQLNAAVTKTADQIWSMVEDGRLELDQRDAPADPRQTQDQGAGWLSDGPTLG